MHRPPPSRIAGLLEAYLLADYRWEADGRWRWLRIGEPAPEVDAAFAQARRYGLISACNPHSLVREDAVNRREDAELHRLLEREGLGSRPAFSSAPDRSWREPGWLVPDIAPGALDALARRFGQLGTLHWTRGQAVRLRMDAVAPPGQPAHPCVDWLR